MNDATTTEAKMTVGLDVSDRSIQLCALSSDGDVTEESRLVCSKPALRSRFEGTSPVRIVLEAGTHSPWISRLLTDLGHEVIVANPRKLRLIYQNDSKSDKVDAAYLAKLGRLDPELLSPLVHRDAACQADIAVIRSRDAAVKARTALVNHVRGSVKSFGARIPKCDAKCFARKAADRIPEELAAALSPVLEVIADLTERIAAYDRDIEKLCEKYFFETKAMRQVDRVGPVTSLAFVLTIGDPSRFEKARSVGSYLGLRPRQSQSGNVSPEMHITKAGDAMLRRLLVGCAQQILGPKGADCDLRRWGLAIAAKGGKTAKKRAVVAVARKLSVLLLRLWVTGEVYEPLRNSSRSTRTLAA